MAAIQSLLGLLLLVSFLGRVTGQQSCNTATNVNQFYNAACTDPLAPYCTSAAGGMRCSACHPMKTDAQARCDCPADSYCDPSPTSPFYGGCRQFSIQGATCYNASNCATVGQFSNSKVFWSCVANECRMCDQATFGTGTLQCLGGWPYPASSRPGETRTCGADGNWVSGGQINVATETTATTSSRSTGTTSSAATSSSNAAALASKGRVALLAGICVVLCALLI